MPIRKLNINDIVPFDYAFDGPIAGQMADVGSPYRPLPFGRPAPLRLPPWWMIP